MSYARLKACHQKLHLASHRSLWRFKTILSIGTLLLLLILLPNAARADLIVTLSPSSLSASPGDTVTFMGQITNITGVDLNGTDMFLNFSGFDPTALIDVNQVFGTPDFLLLDHHISPLIDLFSLTVAPTTASGTYILALSLQDINNNTSSTVDAEVIVRGTVPVPEPSSGLMGMIGIASLVAMALGHKKKH